MKKRVIGRQEVFFEKIDSTNTQAFSLAQDPANHGLVILAQEQTSGRGQHGRSWQAPAGSSVLMSVLVFPGAQLRRPALLTAWAAVSVCELIKKTVGLQAKIKWPNDVLLRGRKVCGILIEQRSSGPDLLATVVGIGLNVSQEEQLFTKAGLPEAGSLAMFSPTSLDCRQVARDLVLCLDKEYRGLEEGEIGVLEACWKWHLGLLGKKVLVEGREESCRGRLKEIAFAGLELELPGKTVRAFKPEEIKHIHPLG